jgi:hypothetical protein
LKILNRSSSPLVFRKEGKITPPPFATVMVAHTRGVIEGEIRRRGEREGEEERGRRRENERNPSGRENRKGKRERERESVSLPQTAAAIGTL